MIRKHTPLTKKQIEEKFKEAKDLRKDLSTNAEELEKNLLNFNKIVDPIVNPEDGKPLCWVRRPTQTEWEEMLPSELLEFRNKPSEEVPKEVWKKYTNLQFDMMAKLIETPKKEAEWWKENSNLIFQQLFQLHLNGIFEMLGIDAENF